MVFIVLGLGSILFAISIDKPELNSGIPKNNGSLKCKVEPVIEAPTPGINFYNGQMFFHSLIFS